MNAEKTTTLVKFRATANEKQAYKQASGGNVSRWLKQMANAKCFPVATKTPLRPNSR